MRYRGFPEIVFVLVHLGLLFLDAAASTLSWRAWLAETAGCAVIKGEVHCLSRHVYTYFLALQQADLAFSLFYQ
jgi:predicted TIM-barrel fold metal-dependent hydrolase